MTYRDEFGCLPLARRIEWSWGEIEPLEDQPEVWEHFEGKAHPRTRIVHVPITVTRTEDPRTGELADPIPGTKRVAEMYPLEETHGLSVNHPELRDAPQDEARQGLAGFAVLLTGFLLGFRTQFVDWRIYGAWRMKSAVGFLTTPPELSRALDDALPTWERFSDRDRVSVTNVLFQYLRTDTLDFQWERFLYRYMLCDACYRVAVRQGRVPEGGGHSERWHRLSDGLGIPRDAEADRVIGRLVSHRNELIHECTWGGHALGHGYPDDPVSAELNCAHFLERVIVAVLGIPAKFVGTRWWDDRNIHGFDLPSR